ncbi:MAG: hypothetical protein AAFW84_09765 [Cyanobacteria bacterium J06635_15]
MDQSPYLNVEAFYDTTDESWKDHWNHSLSAYENSRNILARAVALPCAEIQLPVAIAYAWTNAKWSRVLGIHLAFGPEGSGKSTVAKFARGLRETESWGEACSFASVRNYLQGVKYLDEECEMEADGAALILDNVYSSTFQGSDNKLRSLILSGYKKADDRLIISSTTAGENLHFRTFSTKLISSVDPIHESYELRELRRRLLFTIHKKWEEMGEDERPDFDMSERIDFDDMSFSGIFESEYLRIYGADTAKGQRGPVNIVKYAEARKAAKRSRSYPAHFTAERKEICIDPIATLLLIGGCETVREGIEIFSRYWEFVDARMAEGSDILKQHLQPLLLPFEEAAKYNGGCVKVPMTLINQSLSAKHQAGEFMDKPRGKDVYDAMRQLGFSASTESSKTVWIRSV